MLYQKKFTPEKVAFHANKTSKEQSKDVFRWKQESDPAELAEISFCNNNVLCKNEILQTYWQNGQNISIKKT